jgi:diguanylate cyclase (GGDEF)-like protein
MNEQTPRAGLPLVLLAGDHKDDAHWLRSILESAGYAVLREPTARYALERARATEPDVIIINADLPDMPGTELCRLLRADPRVSSSTPLLLAFREHASRDERIGALRSGAWEWIAPPHEADEILLKIGAYVRAKLDADRARAEGLLDPVTGLYNRQGLARRARELGSQAFRAHGALACVVLALDVETPPQPGSEGATNLVVRCVHALKSSARLSDVVGRLSPTEFAVLAPGTDASGARRLAERLASTVQTSASAGTEETQRPLPPLRVRCGYEAVANVGYAPIEPVDLLVRASTALRTGRAEGGNWLRRFDEGASASP